MVNAEKKKKRSLSSYGHTVYVIPETQQHFQEIIA